MKNILFKSISELKNLLQKKEITEKEVLDLTITQIQKSDPSIGSVLEVFEKDSIKNYNSNGPLSGIPSLIKDTICQKNRITSCASKILENYISPYDATVVSRLKNDGSLLIGRTNCDEFAMGSSTEFSAFQKTYNPWNKECVPGGSSGGSAAAVSAGFVPFALGTETGGSVRQPAAFCGIVGLKPTYGMISRYGVVAYASSIDQVGIFTRTVSDSATVFSSLAGKDLNDGTSKAPFEKNDYTKNLLNSNIRGKKIGIVHNAFYAKGVLPLMQEKMKDALSVFEKEGAIIEEINLPTMEYSAAIYIILSRAEAASNLARFDGIKYGTRKDGEDLMEMYEKTRGEGFGDLVRKRIIIGNYVLSSGYSNQYYKKAKLVQALMKQEFNAALEKYDVLFLPTTPAPAFKIGEMSHNALALDLQDYFTAPANLTLNPAISLPCGFINNMPVGFQLMTKAFNEETLFEFGEVYQKNTSWHTIHPEN